MPEPLCLSEEGESVDGLHIKRNARKRSCRETQTGVETHVE